MSNFLSPVFGTEPQHDAYQALLRVKRLNYARDAFAGLRFKAAMARFFGGARQTRRTMQSAHMEYRALRTMPGEVFELPITAIRGIDAGGDFDIRFRPLKRTQREAWVRAFLNFDCEKQTVLRLRKTVEGFTVEEGAYSLSVMVFLGYKHVQATISPKARAGTVAAETAVPAPLPDDAFPMASPSKNLVPFGSIAGFYGKRIARPIAAGAAESDGLSSRTGF